MLRWPTLQLNIYWDLGDEAVEKVVLISKGRRRACSPVVIVTVMVVLGLDVVEFHLQVELVSVLMNVVTTSVTGC